MAGANFRSSRTNCEPSIPGIKWSVITAPMFSCPTLLRSRASAAFADVAAWLSIPAFRNTNGGWYDDPYGLYTYRYWDGDDWTDHTSNGS